MLGSLIGSSSPLTITQMLWVNLIMDTFAAGALASLPPSWDVLKERPRKSGENGDFIITKPMTRTIFIVAALFVAVQMLVLYHFNIDGVLTPYEQSWFFTFFVMLQFWNMFNAKAFMTGRSAFSGIKDCGSGVFVAFVILIGQYLIVTFGGEMFNVTPLSLHSWLVIIAITSPVLWIGELARIIVRK